MSVSDILNRRVILHNIEVAVKKEMLEHVMRGTIDSTEQIALEILEQITQVILKILE